jgi:AcrR family transcriptional regulator
LSRSSFYDYFPARDDLLVAIAIRAIEEWDHEIEAALDAAGPGLPELRAFIHETMAMTASGRHDLAGTLRQAELSPHRYEELMRLHEAVVRPLRRVLSDLGVPEGHNGIWFVQGVLTAGIDLVSHGSDHHAVAEDVYRFVATGLGLVADPQS